MTGTWPPSRLYEQRKALESAKEIVRRVHADGKLTDVQRDEQLYKINQRWNRAGKPDRGCPGWRKRREHRIDSRAKMLDKLRKDERAQA